MERFEIERKMKELRSQKEELEAFIDACANKPDAERCPIFKRVNATP